MDQYTVQITDRALADMEEIYSYIAIYLQSPENALGQYSRIVNAIMTLNFFPKRTKFFEINGSIKEIRKLIVDNYSIFYLINGMTVIVIRILYSASNIENRLLE